ncbi:helix-turn-helix domain-containing protein [Prosthecochloris sp. SCSIO W1103]|uniref:helix-turn-helix domain-containing protein n=1 Tax=Prosthecochloris sp. SCSIO W1103 TaxID=2992244 RepID=UPI00223DA035|nr:AraC family transcriptional regulator [Prosthecochloris sp. SCSIO W1103]UZJ36604.1 helix-turn-helix domain-containing protein [Prosthecochloris sp. SCSIO W1103]
MPNSEGGKYPEKSDRNSIFGGMKKGTDIVVDNLPDDFFGIFPLNHKLPGMDGGYFQPNLFQIVWFTESTEAEHLIDFEQHPVTADTFYCLGPGQVHFVSGGPLEGLRLLCPIEMFLDIVDDKSRWLFNQLNNDGIVVSNEVLQVLEPLSQIMVKEFQGANDPEIFKAYLKAFLCHIARSGPGYSISYGKDAARLHMLFSIVNKFYRSEKKVSFYANRVGLSPKRLNEILSQTTGSTLTAILHYNLITHAKREIGYGDKNFKQIAFELGFSEQAYFSRFFKRHTGLSPEAFRRKMFKLSKHSGQ